MSTTRMCFYHTCQSGSDIERIKTDTGRVLAVRIPGVHQQQGHWVGLSDILYVRQR
jgi:hypothetical protein